MGGIVSAWLFRGGAAAVPVVGALALGSVTADTLAAATAPHAGFDALIAGVAALAGWLVLARLAAAAVAVAVAALPGAVGRTAAGAAEVLTPALLRGLVRMALGAAVVSGPVLSGPGAWADPVGDGGGLPVLDRVASIPRAPLPAPPTPVAAGPPDVVVRPGDCLWHIAERALPVDHTPADVARAWPRWYAANRTVIGPDPHLIRPGQRLRAPVADSTTTSLGGTS
jgi:nucleoid-associated protein YgaU